MVESVLACEWLTPPPLPLPPAAADLCIALPPLPRAGKRATEQDCLDAWMHSPSIKSLQIEPSRRKKNGRQQRGARSGIVKEVISLDHRLRSRSLAAAEGIVFRRSDARLPRKDAIGRRLDARAMTV